MLFPLLGIHILHIFRPCFKYHLCVYFPGPLLPISLTNCCPQLPIKTNLGNVWNNGFIGLTPDVTNLQAQESAFLTRHLGESYQANLENCAIKCNSFHRHCHHQMTPLWWQKVKRKWRVSWRRWKRSMKELALWEKARGGCFERTASKHVYYLGWNRAPAQAGCMRQVLGPGALGRPRGIGMGKTCKSMADSFQCMTKPTTIKK